MFWCACLVLFSDDIIYLVREKDSLSFPGGKIEPSDIGIHETAVREFVEEVYAIPKKTHRKEIYTLCPKEIILKMRNKQYHPIIRKSFLHNCHKNNSKNSKNSSKSSKGARDYKDGKNKDSKDTIYYCIYISKKLGKKLAKQGMYACKLEDFAKIKMRKRESSLIKSQILTYVFKTIVS